MTNVKSTKKALIASILSLCMCFSMLLGTTFAWFTDSVTSANNVITAGNLDVELEYYNGKDWKTVNESREVFDKDALWEPGYTKVVYLKLTNKGTLDFKYQLGININSETMGKNKDGKLFKLSDYIYFDVVEDVNGETEAYADRTAVDAVKTEKTLISEGYTKSATLKAKADPVYLAMVVYMPETVGNDANYGETKPEINLGLNVFATQVTGEGDSFGNDYDANAPMYNVLVTNEAELKEALANAKNGDVIGISGTVTWTTGGSHGSTPFVEPVATVDDDAKDALTYITLVGVGEGATFKAIGAGVGPVGIDGGTVIFKNLTIADESESYKETAWEFGYLEFRGNTVFEDCEIVNAIMMEGDSATFKNCSFNSNKSSEYAVWVSDGVASFENCYFTGPRGIKVHEAYGSEVDTVVINNNRFENLTEKPGLAIGNVNADTTITITNNMFAATQAGDQGNYMYEYDTDVETFDFTDKDNTVADYADTDTELKDAIQNNATVVLPEGEYTLPTLYGKEGVTLIGAVDGSTVIGGENTSTGFGSNFGKNTTIKNITFRGSTNGVRSSYANGGTSTFENCTFAGDSTYGFHIDESNAATFIFNNCTFSGFNAFAGDLEKVTFNNCTFLHNGNYGHTNIWSVGEFNNCTWGEGATYGTRGDGVIYIDGVKQVSNVAGLKTANGGKVALNGTVNLGGTAGNYITLTEDTTITGGTIKGTGWTGETNYGVNATAGNIVFDGVTFDTTDWTTEGWAKWGISVNVNGTANVTFKNCTFKGTQCPIYQSGSESVVTLENCKFETTSVAIQCEIYSGDFQLGQDLIVKGCDFTGLTDVLHIYDYDKNPSSEAIAQYLTENGNTFTGICKQTCK